MAGTRGRRTGTAVRRATGRPLSRAASRPLPAGDRAGGGRAGLGRPAARSSVRRSIRASVGAAPRRPLFTGRSVLLVGLVLLLALTLAGPIRQYLAGRTALTQLAAQGSALQEQAQRLQAQLDQQADPAWTVRQARQRLNFVLPGDRLIVVVDGRTATGDAGTLPDGARHTPRPVPWYDGLLQSVASADRAGRGPGR